MASSTSIDDNFDAATTYVGSLAANGDVSETDLLKFYGLFKQATEGPCETAKPAFFDLKGRTKWAAWKNVGNISSEEARTAYIDLLTSLKPEWNQGASSKRKTGGGGGGAGGGVFSSLAHIHDDDDDELENDDEVHEGSTELIMAASVGNIERVSQLLEEGAHPNQRDAEGCSALHWAADRGHCSVITQLINSKADMNAVDGDGLTPLHYAALAEQKEAAIALLESGSDPLIKNQGGETAADLAPSGWNNSVFNI